MLPSLTEIVENFEFLEDWEDRYKYVIELGRMLPEFPDDMRSEDNLVRGCVSQVWLVKTLQKSNAGDTILVYQGDSDALIVKGLVALVLSAFSGKSIKEIPHIDIEKIFNTIGLRDHLSPQRSNGLNSMLERIRSDAAKALNH